MAPVIVVSNNSARVNTAMDAAVSMTMPNTTVAHPSDLRA
jgi:hypothetical protein